MPDKGASGPAANIPSDQRRQRGRAGEALAGAYLEIQGYGILHANYRSRYGEIDIIARRGRTVAFIEVKARRSKSFGEPFESVGLRKQSQIRRMALMWVAAHQSDPSLRDCVFRFDIISVLFDAEGSLIDVRHMEDAFR
ncbi:MAG: YraN family protein [Thermoleophilia bacterium]|nr:YraN family protein [Thermoleophilia bacterium]